MELGDRDHRAVDRVGVARDDGLQRAHDLRAGDHRIARMMGHGAVPATAGELDLDAIGGGHHRARAHRELAERQARPVVHAEHLLGRETLEQPLLEHHPAARPHLLGGLEDEVDRAGEVARLGEVAGGAEQHGGMAVMAAGVHPARLRRGVGQTRRLRDRQRVHVRAQADRAAAGSRPEHADHAGRGDAGVDLVEAEAAQLLGDQRRGAGLLEAELRMGMEVAAPGRHLVVKVADPVDDRHRGHSCKLEAWTSMGPSPTPAAGRRRSARSRCRAEAGHGG